jgi:predicted DNA-binding transcriptional regulator AlpA
VNEFCAAYGICRATFYNLRKRGEAPSVMHVGSRTIIPLESADAWQAARMVVA